MKKHLTILISALWCIMLWLWQSHAQSVSSNDCSLAQAYRSILSDSEDTLLSERELIKGINESWYYPVEAVTLALDNLSSYCCFWVKQIPNSLCGNVKKNLENIPTSPFLFDHLIDIWLRRLDGDPDNIYGNEGILDKQWVARRETIREEATNIAWVPSQAIYSKYIETRGKDNSKWLYKYSAWDNDNACKLFTEPLSASFNLTDKYTLQCDIALCIYRDITQNNALGSSNSPYLVSDVTYKLENGYANCKDMTHTRVLSELEYVKATMISQWNQFVLNHTEAHTNQYFVWSRLNRLMTKRLKQLTWREIINRKVVEWTKQCSI